MSRTRTFRRLAFSFVAFVLVLGGAELALRLGGTVAGRVTMPKEMIDAHLRGAAFRFHADLGWYWPALPSPGSQIDVHGFRRTKPVQVERTPGTRRVIAFGDSQTFGAGVDADHTWPAYAEGALGDGWEVLNAGLSGFRSLNVYRLIRLRMGRYAPDALIIDCMPYDSPRDDGSLLGAPTDLDVVRAALWNSRIYYYLRVALWKADPYRARWLDRPAAPNAPGRHATHGQTPGNHDLIAQWGDENGVKVIFMRYPVMNREGRIDCMTLEGELPPGYPVIDACEAVRTDGRSAKELFLDNNHLTLAGNALVGETVAAVLRDVLK